MATVWLARDLRHDRPVALKVLSPDLAATLGPERFQREIKLAARLQHPNIVSVYDSGEAGGRLWYAMPYVEGESLRDRLRRGPVPASQAIGIARQAAQALRYAHDHGVIHRDVKPENILLTSDGNALVADFGIARPLRAEATAALTSAGLVIGTPSYMSPEQASGQTDLDGRSDIYSLGCVLYEMLAGVPPFTGPTAQAVVAAHLSRPPAELPPGTAAAPLRQVVARALAKHAADRYADTAAFLAGLDEAAAGAGPTAAAGRGTVGRLVPALALLIVVAGLGYGASRYFGAPEPHGDSVASGFNRTLEQLTFDPAPEEWPAWSPDGRFLVYVAEVDGLRQIFVRTVETGEERQVSTAARRDHIQPAWAPDGGHVAYVRARSEGGRLEPTDPDGWYEEGGDIRLLELATGRDVVLVEDAFGPSFASDGTTLAFDSRWAGPRRIWLADARGRNPRQVSADSSDAVVHVQPRWAPDGRRIAFRRIEKTISDIAVVELAGNTVTRVTSDGVLDADPVWAPDGDRIYFSSPRGGGLNLWRVAVGADGRPASAPEQLTTGAGSDVQPAIAPDGRRLAFAVRGTNTDLWRLPVSPATGRATGPPEPVLATTRVENRGAWSPDGGRIAFNSDRQGEMNIWVRNLADGGERRVTEGTGGDYQPTWSPDGQRLVFFSSRGGNTDIYAVPSAGGPITRLTDDPALDINPFTSPDGNWIAFMSDRSGRVEAWVMRADGSEQRQLAQVGVWGHFLRWTADSRAVIFRTEHVSPVRIVSAALSDGTLSDLPDIASGAHISFSPDGTIAMDVRGHQSLWAHPMDGSPPYQVFEFDDLKVRIDYPVWSPDGRWVLFDRVAPGGGDLWMLDGLGTPAR